jgi:acetyltransferase-like isoleucine patch superfamily enzyme
MSRDGALPPTVRRQIFFLKQKLYALVSAVLLDNAPSGRMRARLLRAFGAHVGDRVVVRGGLRVQDEFNFVIHDDVFINSGCCLDGSAQIEIGSRTHLGYEVTLITVGHEIGAPEQRAGAHTPAPISIGAGCWVGARSVILPGVSLGPGCVVAAGSVVTRDVDGDTVVAGMPARPVRSLPRPTPRSPADDSLEIGERTPRRNEVVEKPF